MYSFHETVEADNWVTVTRSLGSEENTSPPTDNTDMSAQRSHETCNRSAVGDHVNIDIHDRKTENTRCTSAPDL